MARPEQLERLLADLSRLPGAMGAAILTRDGLGVRASGRPELSRETFSAMSATLVGAAEIALSELAAGRVRAIVTFTERAKLVLLGATSDLVLVIYARPDAPTDSLVQAAESAAGAVASVVAG